MAITCASLIALNSSVAASSFTTGSFTLHANKLGMAMVFSSRAAGISAAPTITGWTFLGTVTFPTAGLKRISLFHRTVGTDLTGTLQASFGGTSQDVCNIHVVEFTVATLSGTNGIDNIRFQIADAVSTDSDNQITINLSAFENAANAGYFVMAKSSTGVVSPRSGWTEMNEGTGTSIRSQVQFKNSSDTIAQTDWSPAASVSAGAMFVEIRDVGVPPTITVSRTVTIAGAATVTLQSQTIATRTFAIAGTADAVFDVVSIKPRTFTIVGIATVSLLGSTVGTGVVVASENYRENLVFGAVVDVPPEVFVGTAGWTNANGFDVSSGRDRRLAGIAFKQNDGIQGVRPIPLLAPGMHRIRLALGTVFARDVQYVQIRDNITPVLTVYKPGGNASGEWFNAKGEGQDEATWVANYDAGYVDCNFLTTSLRIILGTPTLEGAQYSTLAHFSVESLTTGGILSASFGIVGFATVTPLAGSIQGRFFVREVPA